MGSDTSSVGGHRVEAEVAEIDAGRDPQAGEVVLGEPADGFHDLRGAVKQTLLQGVRMGFRSASCSGCHAAGARPIAVAARC